MKQELIDLAFKHKFSSKFLYQVAYKYSTKEDLRYLFWMTELQQWLRLLDIDITIITNYNLKDQYKSYRCGIIYIEQLKDRRLIESFFIRPENEKYLFIEFDTYEEALESGLLEALKLIK